MRTTLKRGVGRGGALNGNGRAVLPPAAHTPVAVYRTPEPPKRTGWQVARRFFGWFVVGLAVLAVALLGGSYLYFHESVAQIRAHSIDVKTAQKRLAIPLPGQAAIALVIGYDHRANEGNGAPSRSDTMMLLRADPQTKTISMLSLPRDLVVNVVCPGRGSTRQKINYAYAWCGSKGTVETVKELTGLPINYLITVNFRGFKQVVNRLGGVWIDVDHRYYNNQSGPNGYATINLSPGYQRLTGGAALDYVRFRHTDSDFFRVARQQQFVKAIRYQLKHKFSITTLPALVNALTHNVEVGVGGSGQLSGATILSYARFIFQLPPGGFVQSKIEVTGYSDVQATPAAVAKAVQEFSNPDVGAPAAAISAAGLAAKAPKAQAAKAKAPVAPLPADTTITVLNGNGVGGSATNASYLLGLRGYKVVLPASGKLGNAPTWTYFRTKVYYAGSGASGRLAAQKVADLFGGADVSAVTPDIANLTSGALLTVVVGQTFHNTLAAAPVQRVVQRQAASLRNTRGAYTAQLKAIRAPFRLMAPTVIDSSSVLSTSQGIRAYALDARHKAVRLVFRQGSGQYWGIEMTDWADAPILHDRSFQRTIGGRHYDLHYDGLHLHMVVLRSGGATYWVVNTLLDALSNETMLAIAKGLQPVPR